MTEKNTNTSYQVPDSSSVDLSWKRYLLPAIHKEGLKIFAVAVILVLFLGLLDSCFLTIGIPQNSLLL